VADEAQRNALESVSFEDVAITSDITVTGDAAPAEAFRMPEAQGVAVVFEKADGAKCERCWKVLPDVGTHEHPGVCGRCDEAVREALADA
jgi:isoleucyl-tRNA synthetase